MTLLVLQVPTVFGLVDSHIPRDSNFVVSRDCPVNMIPNTQRCSWLDCSSLNVLSTQNWETLSCEVQFEGKINEEHGAYVKVNVKFFLEEATRAQRGE